MAITPLPDAPSRADPINFPARADAWVAGLDQFTTEANALQVDVNLNAALAEDSAAAALVSENAAASSAQAAVNATGAPLWVSGQTYSQYAPVRSPITLKVYVRYTTSGSGTTDPSVDAANYRLAAGILIEDWQSGVAYDNKEVVVSPATGGLYRKITPAASGATDPSSDATNFKQLGSGTPGFVLQAMGII